MLVDTARESGNPNLRAIIFRQQFTQMTDIVAKLPLLVAQLCHPLDGREKRSRLLRDQENQPDIAPLLLQ
jgi:hypothetical protein